jgi:hypothetical protein
LLEGDVAAQFLADVLSHDKVKALLSSEHFSVDGTLLGAWASLRAFGRRTARANLPVPDAMANGTSMATAEQRQHRSTTEPEARLARKRPGKEARLCFMGTR